MSGDSGVPSLTPPSPKPKRRNAVLRFFDAPLYRDWLFWLVLTWAVLECVAIPTEGSPNDLLPVWLNVLIGVVFSIVFFGILPAWIRLIVRRMRWRRRPQSGRIIQTPYVDAPGGNVESAPPSPLPKRKNAVWRLFDAPLYRDWLFWLMATWTALECVAIPTESPLEKSSSVWSTVLVGVIFSVVIFGILPAWIRLLFRRTRWQRRQQAGRAISSAHVRAFGDDVGPGRPSETLQEVRNVLRVAATEGPVLVGVDDPAPQPTSATVTPASSHVHWERIDADGFERLLARLLEQSGSYVRITRLMKVNAADAGLDIQAYLRIDDGLGSERYERIIVQAKHWPKRGVGASEIADLVYAKLPLWEGEPIRGLIVATTGSFTQDAVRWVDNHNQAAKRPDIVLLSSNELELLLRKWPNILVEFGLID